MGALTTNQFIAAIPMVAELRREHAIAMAQPMIGAQMVGEPWIADLGARDPLFARRACQYATVLLRRREPSLPDDLGHLFAAFEPPATVVFRTAVKHRCRRSGAPRSMVASRQPPPPDGELIVAFTLDLPAHVMGVRPCSTRARRIAA